MWLVINPPETAHDEKLTDNDEQSKRGEINMAVTPIPVPPQSLKPFNLKPVSSPNNLDEIWYLKALDLSASNYIDVSVDAFISDIGINQTKEVSSVGTIRELPTAPIEMRMKSTNVADTFPIQITYLDSNKEYQVAIFILTGTTPVELPEMYRILFVSNASGDSTTTLLEANGFTEGVDFNNGATQGTITVYRSDGDGTLANARTMAGWNQYFTVGASQINVEQSLLSSFTIPRGYRGFPFQFEPILGKNDEVFFAIQTRAPGGPWVTQIPFSAFQNEFQRNIFPRGIPELYDVRVLAHENGGVANVPAAFSYQLLLVQYG